MYSYESIYTYATQSLGRTWVVHMIQWSHIRQSTYVTALCTTYNFHHQFHTFLQFLYEVCVVVLYSRLYGEESSYTVFLSPTLSEALCLDFSSSVLHTSHLTWTLHTKGLDDWCYDFLSNDWSVLTHEPPRYAPFPSDQLHINVWGFVGIAI